MDCATVMYDYRAFVTMIFVLYTVAAILIMRNLTQPEKPDKPSRYYYCRKHGVPENECAEKHQTDD